MSPHLCVVVFARYYARMDGNGNSARRDRMGMGIQLEGTRGNGYLACGNW